MTLEAARLYLVATAHISTGSLSNCVSELAGAGVDVVQLREKESDDASLLRAAAASSAACRSVGIPFVVNDRADIAALTGAGVHLGQDDLPVAAARAILGDALAGLSTHSEQQIDDALSSDDTIDYLAVGPVYETPTKPGRPAVGLELVRYATSVIPREVPWFAIGGIDADNLAEVINAGARRIVVVRAIADAPDPANAAAKLRDMLDSAEL